MEAESKATRTKRRQATAPPEDGWERALAAFAEVSTDAFLLFDANLSLVGTNPAGERLLGPSRKGAKRRIRRNLGDLLHDTQADGDYDRYLSVLRTGQPITTDAVVPSGNGGQTHLNIRAFKVGDGLGVIASDITERKRAEEAVQASESLYRAIFDNAPVGIGIADIQGNVLAGNVSMLETTGYTLAELQSTNLARTYVDPGERRRLLKELQKAGKVRDREVSLRRKDGTVYSALLNVDKLELGGEKLLLTTARDVTRRKKAELALRESENKYRELADLLPEIVFEADEKGTLNFANRNAFAATGYSQEEFDHGLNVLQMMAPEDRKRAQVTLEGVFSGQKTGGNEYTLLRKDGSTVPVVVFSNPIIRGGKPAGAIGIVVDISQRKRMEEAIKESEENFRALAENSLDCISVFSGEGGHVYANKRVAETTGYSTSELLEKTFRDLVHPDDLKKAEQNYARRIRGEAVPGRYEISMATKDGRKILLDLAATRTVWRGKPAVMGVYRDITDRRRAENALREASERYKDLAELLPQIVFEADTSGRFTFANQKGFQLSGYRQQDIQRGLSVLDVLVPEDRDRARKNMRRVLNGEKTGGHEYMMLRKDGSTFPAVIYSSPIMRDGKTVGIRGIGVDVSDRKKAEQALKRSEEHFRALIENASEVIIVLDGDGTILYESPAVEHVLGYKPEEVVGLNSLSFIHPDDLPRVAEEFSEIMQKPGSSLESSVTVRHKGGSWRIAEANAQNLLNNPAVRGIVVNFRDVTERKRAEEALRHSEEHFRALIENAMDVIVVIDKNGIIRYESPAVERVQGFGPQELVGHNLLTRPHPEDMPRATRLFEQVRSTPGARVVTEIRAQHKDGSWRTVEAIGQNLLDIPAVQGIVINYRDVTERKEAERKVAESEQRFRAIVEAMPMALAISRKRDGAIIYANKHFGPAIGAPSSALNSLKTLDLYRDPRDREVVLHRIQKGEPLRDFEYMGQKADGSSFWAMASIEPLEFQGEEALLGAFYDITELKQMEHRLKELYDGEKQLRQQLEVEMNRRVDFTRALAHELKTPLTSVLASSELLASELKEEPLLGLARNISYGAMNLNSTIDELLDLARGQVGMLQLKLESVDISQALRQTAESMAPLASKRSQSLVVEVPATLPMVQADIARLQQVVVNLLSNAVKFSPVRGTITLRAKVKDSRLVVEVQDTGRGISKEEQKHLFEPYHRLQRDGKGPSGLGLGLSLCKTLIELHGGEIWLKSRVGQGATFGFSLPLEAPAQLESTSEQTGKLWKVLIVEDDQVIVDSVSLLLQMRWPEAQLVSTGLGEEGIELVEGEVPDIVIVDLGLPDISGFEVLRRIRLFSSVPVVILTVKAEEADMVKGLEWGADDYVVKPFRQSELLARLKMQLRKRTPPDKEAPIVCGSLQLDPSTFQLTYGGREISLTIVEGTIIQCLMQNAGHVVTHTRLAEAVWGEDYPGALDSLRVYVRYLRQKLEQDPSNPKLILTKPGVGYSLAKPI